jgi:polygalacturonase
MSHTRFFVRGAPARAHLSAVFAQDTRTVTEPKIPPVCRSLQAQLTAPIAEADEAKLDTARLQQAIDSCNPGTAVELRSDGARDAFLSGPLELKPGITLLVGAGTTLFGSRDPKLYENSPGSCGLVDERGRGCRPLIHVGHAPNAAIMGDGTIDGRGGAKLLGKNVTWWDLAEAARAPGKRQNVPRIIVVDESDGFTLYRITLHNSPNFHVSVNKTNGFTAWGVKLFTPKTARNTDGIDPSSSTNVTIVHSWISVGDDNVAIKAGNNGPATHMTIAHNHFYTGHGMSIGSETNGGASDIEVRDLTIDGADNGLRIKTNSTKGGLVHNVSYHDVCIRNTKNPIVIDPFYSTERGNMPGLFEDITLENVRFTRGMVTLRGSDAQHLSKLTFDGVIAEGLMPRDVDASHVRITAGPGKVNFAIMGDDVEVKNVGGNRDVASCEGKFPAFPQDNKPAVTSAYTRPLVVSADDMGDYKSVQQAIDALPDAGGAIRIRPGTYREVVQVHKPHVRIEGDAAHPERVVIVYDNSAGTAGGTLHSGTFNVGGDDFFARGVTFANDFAKTHPPTQEGAQAVALLVTGDRAVFRDVRILGAQDTLYLGSKSCSAPEGPCVPARQFLRDCYVEGHVDFIFGDAMAVFQNCEIHGIPRANVMLTAQSKHYPDELSGYVFDHCKVTADPGAPKVFLGRPWRPYATVIFLNTELPAAVDPAGWREWHPGETHSLDTAFYAEYNSSGPGGDISKRDPHAKQLSKEEAAKYAPERFLAGSDKWNPLLVQ